MPLIRRGTIADSAEPPADPPSASTFAQLFAQRRLTVFVGIGIAAYLLALIVTLPASVVMTNRPWRTGVSGTIWNGEVGVAGGTTLAWRWAPLRSITSLGFAADWRLAGNDADAGGRALARPGRLVLDALSGPVPASVLAAVQPDLPFTCDVLMNADFRRLAFGGGDQMVDGRLLTEAGTCQPKRGGAPSAVPPLVLLAEKIGSESRIRLAPATQRRRTLLTMVLTEEGVVTVTLTPEGAAALPFIGLPPGASLQGTI